MCFGKALDKTIIYIKDKGINYCENTDYYIKKYALKYKLDVNVLRALIMSESAFGRYMENPNDPSYGFGCFKIPTAKKVLERIGFRDLTDTAIIDLLKNNVDVSIHVIANHLAIDLIPNSSNINEVIAKYKGVIKNTGVIGIFNKLYKKYQDTFGE